MSRPKSIPHPELLPLTEEECKPFLTDRDPWLSRRDYSQEEIDEATGKGKMPADMREYCHNNGISWHVRAGVQA